MAESRVEMVSSVVMLALIAGCSSNGTPGSAGPGAGPEAPPHATVRTTSPDKPTDATLLELRASLPEGWAMAVSSTELRLHREQRAWVLSSNRINAPRRAETDEQRAQRIKTHGKQTTPEVTYRLEERWPEAKLDSSRATNARVNEQLATLAKSVEHFRVVGRKGRAHYAPRSPADTQKLRVYETETARLNATRLEVPSCHTETLSLFPGTQRGIEDDMHLVHPPEASAEAYAIIARVRELCERDLAAP